MAKKCHICGRTTLSYIWTTAGNFPREKLPGWHDMSETQQLFYKRIGEPICWDCAKNRFGVE